VENDAGSVDDSSQRRQCIADNPLLNLLKQQVLRRKGSASSGQNLLPEGGNFLADSFRNCLFSISFPIFFQRGSLAQDIHFWEMSQQLVHKAVLLSKFTPFYLILWKM
jgi:hypothetical protein